MWLQVSKENAIFDVPNLNRFKIGDHVQAGVRGTYSFFEGVVVGIELKSSTANLGPLRPSITLLHDGCFTDNFNPDDLSKINSSDPDFLMLEITYDKLIKAKAELSDRMSWGGPIIGREELEARIKILEEILKEYSERKNPTFL